jgi:nicotinamide mononucleotide transporter
MSVLSDLYNAHLTIKGHDIQWIEIIGNAFGFASAIGGLRRRVWAWPVGIVGNILLFAVFIGASADGERTPLLGQAGRQVFFVVVSVYGWYRWRQAKRGKVETAPAVQPRWATAAERATYLAVAVVAVGVCVWPLYEIGAAYWEPPTWYFFADSWILVGSILATYAMARGWVDFWLCWIAVDLVGVPELIHFQRYPSAVLYGVYLLLVLYGFWAWRRIARAEPLAEPEMEAVGL